MNASEQKERRVAWAMLIICPMSMMALFAWVTAGLAPGLDTNLNNGHPMIYLQATCFLWAVISIFLPILRLKKLVALPYWFVAIIYADMYMYVISLCCGFYKDIAWWGDFTHVISGLVVASIVFLALCLVQANSPSHVTLGTRGGVVAMLLFVGASFGGIWELMEGATDILSGTDYMVYGAADTLADMAADMMGVLAMCLIAWFVLRKQDAKDIAADVRIGKKNIDVG